MAGLRKRVSSNEEPLRPNDDEDEILCKVCGGNDEDICDVDDEERELKLNKRKKLRGSRKRMTTAM